MINVSAPQGRATALPLAWTDAAKADPVAALVKEWFELQVYVNHVSLSDEAGNAGCDEMRRIELALAGKAKATTPFGCLAALSLLLHEFNEHYSGQGDHGDALVRSLVIIVQRYIAGVLGEDDAHA